MYNTLTKSVESLLTPDVIAGERPFGLYSCGPTVQDVSHFGHARAALIPDLIRRILIARGIPVLHVRNITDVDDKIIDRANREACSFAAIAETYSRVYEQDMQDLNILVPHIVPRATGHIIEMIEMIQVLLEKGFAYTVPGAGSGEPQPATNTAPIGTQSGAATGAARESGGESGSDRVSESPGDRGELAAGATGAGGDHDVLFRVRTFPEYGRLSGRNVDDMRAGARIQMDDRKEDPADFALWKSAKPGEPGWSSPWGVGRPGWHIECSAMATKYLGDHVDLHTGGNDLIFPHHENEIAQAEAANGYRFAKHWVHNGMLNIDGEKMSKSLGNFITLREALDEYGGDVVRLYYLQHHYRSPASFSGERLEESRQGLERIKTFLRNNPVEALAATSESAEPTGARAGEADGSAGGALSPEGVPRAGGANSAVRDPEDGAAAPAHDAISTAGVPAIPLPAGADAALWHQVTESLDDDLNTPDVIAIVFDLVRKGNSEPAYAPTAAATIRAILDLLGVTISVSSDASSTYTDAIDAIVALRTDVKRAKDFAMADQIRDALAKVGIVIEDRREGPIWRVEGS